MVNNHYFIYDGNITVVAGDPIPSDIVENRGTTYEDYMQGKYVPLSEEHITFLKDNEFSTIEEVWNMTVNPEVTEQEINRLIAKIKEYDTSDDVNTFYINDTPVWFSKELRIALGNSIAVEEGVGKDTTVIWYNDTAYTMPIYDAMNMLNDVELYAIQCFNNTQANIAKAKKLTLRSEIEEFDIKGGYPEKLRFNID